MSLADELLWQFHFIASLPRVVLSWSGNKEWVRNSSEDISRSFQSRDESGVWHEVLCHDWWRLRGSCLPDVCSDEVLWRVGMMSHCLDVTKIIWSSTEKKMNLMLVFWAESWLNSGTVKCCQLRLCILSRLWRCLSVVLNIVHGSPLAIQLPIFSLVLCMT